MSTEKLQKFYFDLAQSLLPEFYFFFPNGEINKQLIQKLDFLKDYKVLDILYVFDSEKGIVAYTSERNNTQILQKGILLEQNIYKLLRKKSKVTEAQFEYLIGEYFNFVDSLYFVTEWMYTNSHLLSYEDEKIKGLLYWQNLHFKKHYDSLRKIFPQKQDVKPEKDVDTVALLEKHFNTISKQIKSHYSIPNLQSLGATPHNTPNTPNTPKELQKKPLVTEDEAEAELLKKYFNLGNKS